jgi:hypothetical protein
VLRNDEEELVLLTIDEPTMNFQAFLQWFCA